MSAQQPTHILSNEETERIAKKLRIPEEEWDVLKTFYFPDNLNVCHWRPSLGLKKGEQCCNRELDTDNGAGIFCNFCCHKSHVKKWLCILRDAYGDDLSKYWDDCHDNCILILIG